VSKPIQKFVRETTGAYYFSHEVPITSKATLQTLHIDDKGGGWIYAVPVLTSQQLEKEKSFYRGILEQIADNKRRTREVRLAKSALVFWDELQREKAKLGALKR